MPTQKMTSPLKNRPVVIAALWAIAVVGVPPLVVNKKGTTNTAATHIPQDATISETPNLRLNRPDITSLLRLAHTLFFFGFEIATASRRQFRIEECFTRSGEIDII
jgi:hypothetical protein